MDSHQFRSLYTLLFAYMDKVRGLPPGQEFDEQLQQATEAISDWVVAHKQGHSASRLPEKRKTPLVRITDNRTKAVFP